MNTTTISTTKRPKQRMLACLIASGLCALTAYSSSLAAQQQAPVPPTQADGAPQNGPEGMLHHDTLHLYAGEARIIKLPAPVANTIVGNGKVISTTMVKPTELLIVANDAGRSTLNLRFVDGSEIAYAVSVGLDNPSEIYTQIKNLFGDDKNINIDMVGKRVFLRATTLKPMQANFIAALQKAFPEQLVLVTGGDTALEERTIYLHAQLVEIKKSALEQLGVDWSTSINGPALGVAGDMATSRRYIKNRPGGSGNLDLAVTVPPFRTAMSIATEITSRINLMKQNGDAYIVAAPRLTVRCGGKADFTSGGEMPISSVSELGHSNTDFKKYGIRLAVESQCDQIGNIRAKLSTEVSQIDRSVVDKNGTMGLLTRKAETELDLVEGKTMLLSGLNALNGGNAENKVPVLGSIPVLGNLFKNTNTNGESSELIVIITPSFIDPDSVAVQQAVQRRDHIVGKTQKDVRDKGIKPQKIPELDFAVSGDASWRPTRVYRDGRQTVIEMPKGVPSDKAPTLMITNAGKSAQGKSMRYRLDGTRYIVDGIFDRAVLVAGSGAEQQSVTIVRHQ